MNKTGGNAIQVMTNMQPNLKKLADVHQAQDLHQLEPAVFFWK